MKNLASFLLLICTSTASYAAPSAYVPVGPNIGYGDHSNSGTVFSTVANPANAAVFDFGKNERFGLGISYQTWIELKNMQGITDDLDNNIKPYLNTNNPANATIVATNLNRFFDQYQTGKLHNISTVDIPMLVHDRQSGITLDYSYSKATDLSLIKQGTITTAGTGTDVSINSGAAAFGISYKAMRDFSLGYSAFFPINRESDLSVGINLRYLNLLANTKAIDVSTFVNDNLGTDTKNADDYLNDMESGTAATAFTADVGLNWYFRNITLGLVGMNLTSPSFKINNLSSIADTPSFSSFIESSYQLKPQYRLTGQIATPDGHWALAGAYDLNKANDLNNQDTQWVSVSASYTYNGAWYIPDLRVGIRNNLQGNEYKYTDFGLSFGFLNLDIATTTTDFSSVGDQQKDAGLMASIGMEFVF